MIPPHYLTLDDLDTLADRGEPVPAEYLKRAVELARQAQRERDAKPESDGAGLLGGKR